MKVFLLSGVIFIIVLFLFAGCGGSSSNGDDQTVKNGDFVSVQYRGTLEDGTQFDSSYDRGQPITFTVGAGQMIAGFDEAVLGMKIGEKKTVTLPPEEAYGTYIPELVVTMERDKFPQDMVLTVGKKVLLTTTTGQQVTATVIEVGDTTVTLDANHELAGKTLIFEIELVSITPGVG